MPRFIDLTGHKYGRVTVLEKARGCTPDDPFILWRCRCDCGTEFIARGSSLRNGNTKSCGCLRSPVRSRELKLAYELLRQEQAKGGVSVAEL